MAQYGSDNGLLSDLTDEDVGDAIFMGGEGGAGVGRWVRDVLVTPGDDLHTALMRGNINEEQVSPGILMLERNRRYRLRRMKAEARAATSTANVRPRAAKGLNLDDMSSGAAVVAYLAMLSPAVNGRARGEAKEAFVGQTHRTKPDSVLDRLNRRDRGNDFA